jgi:16S rRNA (cytosine967-C5)-methyltransferase
MPAPARIAAFRVLRALDEKSIDLGDALSQARDPLPDARDRALATDLAVGTLRWRGALDYQLQLRSARPLARLDSAVVDALRLGAYQMLHLERVPVSAIVNDSVDLVKAAGLRSAAAFVNAVLRRLARERGALSWPPRADLAVHLSVVQSHPLWLVERWLTRYGEDGTERWLRFNNEPPAMTLAVNRLRITREQLRHRLADEQIETRHTAVAPHGLTVTSGRALSAPAFRDGLCVVQDEASQIVPELLQASRAQRILDACASPGGKTVGAAAQCGLEGRVIAADIRSRRVRLLAATIARCQTPNVRIVHIDPVAAFPFAASSFDRVLIDAPCSGLGTVRRDPDIRWRRDPRDFEALAHLQLDLLRRARRVVADEGAIVYSTCTSEPEENEQVVERFLSEAPEFRVDPIAGAASLAYLQSMQTAEGYLRTTPVHGLEAFFGAVLRKTKR